MARLALSLVSTLAALIGLALVFGWLLPAAPRISFEQTRGENTDIYALDIAHQLAVNLTRSPALDVSAQWSPDGTRMAFLSARDSRLQLHLMSFDGSVRRLDDQPVAPSYHPVWSPDGDSIVYEVDAGNRKHLSIVVVDQPLILGSNPRVLTASQTDDRFPAWSPDGTRIAFVSWREGNAEIFAIDPDGGNLVNLTQNPGWDVSPSWSPDSQKIAFFALRDTYRELYMMDRDGGSVRQITDAQEVNNGNYWGAPVWSPDGSAIAYQTVIDGNPEIVVTRMDSAGEYRLTNEPELDALPLWLPDGERIVYMAGRGERSALYIAAADGSSVRALTRQDSASKFPALWN